MRRGPVPRRSRLGSRHDRHRGRGAAGHDAVHARRAAPRPRGGLQPLVRARPLLRRLHGRAVAVRRPTLRGHARAEGSPLRHRARPLRRRRPGVVRGRSTGSSTAATTTTSTGPCARCSGSTPTAACSRERDHIHTLLYRHAFTAAERATTPCPPSWPSTTPSVGMTATLVRPAAGRDRRRAGRATSRARSSPSWSSASRRSRCRPTRPSASRATTASTAACCTCPSPPPRPTTWWDEQRAAADRLRADGIGEMLWTAPFVPTIPGTDTYTDQLW